MRPRFASEVLNGWEEPDHTWIRVVRRRARFVWVRLCGINELELGRDDRETIEWEDAAVRLAPERTTCAFLVVRFNRTVRALPCRPEFGLQNAAEARQRWVGSMPLSARLDVLLRVLAASQPHPVGVFAEDFSARWLAESGFLPAAAVLDNPVVSVGEARGAYAALFSRPGYVRASRWPALGGFDFWKMHFPVEDLAAYHLGLPSGCRHGRWHTMTEAELAAARVSP